MQNKIQEVFRKIFVPGCPAPLTHTKKVCFDLDMGFCKKKKLAVTLTFDLRS